jgi:hypothetical protein
MRFRLMKTIWEGNIRQRAAPPGDGLLMSLLFTGRNTTFGKIVKEEVLAQNLV